MCYLEKEHVRPPGVNETFESIRSSLVIKESNIAGRGTFVGRGKLLKHEAFGFYEGVLSKLEGAYTMTLFKGPNAIHVNASPALVGHETLLGSINEDLYGGVPNCEVYPDGIFRSLRECNEGEELVIRYWSDYNWDELKNSALQGLLRLIAARVPEMWGWIPKSWSDLKISTDHISRWIYKLINGDREIEGARLHSSCGSEQPTPRLELVRLLTLGPTARKFNFRILGREDKVWPMTPFASRSRIDYTEHCNDIGLMDVPFKVVMKDNGSIRTFGECISKMQKPGKGADLSEVPEVLTYVGRIRIALRVRTRQKQKLLRDLQNCTNMAQLRSTLENRDLIQERPGG